MNISVSCRLRRPRCQVKISLLRRSTARNVPKHRLVARYSDSVCCVLCNRKSPKLVSLNLFSFDFTDFVLQKTLALLGFYGSAVFSVLTEWQAALRCC